MLPLSATIRQPLPGKLPRSLTIPLVMSSFGRKGFRDLSPESPSYHQNFSGGKPSRAGNSKVIDESATRDYMMIHRLGMNRFRHAY